jgi:hypothetical protein
MISFLFFFSMKKKPHTYTYSQMISFLREFYFKIFALKIHPEKLIFMRLNMLAKKSNHPKLERAGSCDKIKKMDEEKNNHRNLGHLSLQT